ncbi:MAG: amidohydrolase, partial [Cytophaga sp.]|nr:amidohydrolase [Cytophaga sp.]
MKKILTLSVLWLLAIAGFAQRTLIHCGSLIDGKSKDIQSQVTIVVEAGKIVSLDKGFAKPGKDDKLIDLSKKTVMPGLIDMHVHVENETSKDNLVKRFTQNEADVAFQATVYAKKNLMAGFTTVRDCGGSGVNISIRNAINQGIVVGPRIFTAGKGVATTGGHGDPTNGSRKDLQGDPGPKEGVINGPEEAYKAVRQRYKDGADFIKITATGGVLSVAKDGSGPQFTQEEVNAIVLAA